MKHSWVGWPYWQVGATGVVPLAPDDDVLPLAPDDDEDDDVLPLAPDDPLEPPGPSTEPPHAGATRPVKTPVVARVARKRRRREELVMPLR